jgi:hypothetical protein
VGHGPSLPFPGAGPPRRRFVRKRCAALHSVS